mmetsp:Transcript_51861/g.112443  ORF Transcript_51861/g.112443 Transcript_51861/m.112443 type:complete len:200 (-) Transcript_51861:189-788(-)
MAWSILRFRLSRCSLEVCGEWQKPHSLPSLQRPATARMQARSQRCGCPKLPRLATKPSEPREGWETESSSTSGHISLSVKLSPSDVEVASKRSLKLAAVLTVLEKASRDLLEDLCLEKDEGLPSISRRCRKGTADCTSLALSAKLLTYLCSSCNSAGTVKRLVRMGSLLDRPKGFASLASSTSMKVDRNVSLIGFSGPI